MWVLWQEITKGQRKIKGNLRNLSDSGNINWYLTSIIFFLGKKRRKKNLSYRDLWNTTQSSGEWNGDNSSAWGGSQVLPQVLWSTPPLQSSCSHARDFIHSTKGEETGWRLWYLRTSLPASFFVQRMYLSHKVKHRKRESVLHAFKHRDYWYCHCLGLPTNNAPSWVIYSQCIIFDGWRAEKLFSTFENDCSYKVIEQYLISVLKPILEAPDKLPEDGVCNTQKAKMWRTNKHWSHS